MRDPYQVLGVEKGATKDEISSAYKKKALLHHPDRNPGDKMAETMFREATEACGVLSDEAKRLAYDMASAPGGHGHPNANGDSFPWDVFQRAGGPFHNPFGGSPFGVPHGKDVESTVQLTVEESVLGTKKKVLSPTRDERACDRCSGSRAEPGTRRIPCTACAGSGRSFFPSRAGGRAKCGQCDGRGEIPIRQCGGCAGTGRVRVKREVLVNVPAGISDGQKLRLAGQGEPGLGGPPGDMYVVVEVVEGGSFTRDGNDLHMSVRIPFAAAMGHHGGKPEFTVRGIDGREYRVGIPQSFRPGETQLLIRGAGVGGMGGDRGNLHVVVHVDLPEVNSARAAALVRELVDELSGGNGAPSPDD
jgi:molecular chaperone DnaJ